MLKRDWKGAFVSAFGLVVLGTIAFGVPCFFIFQDRHSGQSERGRALEAVDHAIYVRDHGSGMCFAVSWVVYGDRRQYLMSWVPCTDHLPVATPPVKPTEQVVPL